jgi:hypothetical protein
VLVHTGCKWRVKDSLSFNQRVADRGPLFCSSDSDSSSSDEAEKEARVSKKKGNKGGARGAADHAVKAIEGPPPVETREDAVENRTRADDKGKVGRDLVSHNVQYMSIETVDRVIET